MKSDVIRLSGDYRKVIAEDGDDFSYSSTLARCDLYG